MKLITAIVTPDKVGDVVEAVMESGGRGLTVTEVRGPGGRYREPATDRALTRLTSRRHRPVLRKIRLDAVVLDGDAEAVVDAIGKCASTGSIRDVTIWVKPVDSSSHDPNRQA